VAGWPRQYLFSLPSEPWGRLAHRTQLVNRVQLLLGQSRRPSHPLAVEVEGSNLEATTRSEDNDRPRVESVCRFLFRGPLALDRLTINDDGNAVYALRKCWRRALRCVVAWCRPRHRHGDKNTVGPAPQAPLQ
jgi:hypothetical protein